MALIDEALYEALMVEGPAGALLAELLHRPAWHASAACRDRHDVQFFPEQGQSRKPAQEVCEGCPVRPECLAAGLDGHEMGIWGGTSERARRAMRRARRNATH